MIRDTIDSIKASLYERAASPFLSAFGLSWVVVNYRLILLLISDLKPKEKFDYIDTVLYPDTITIFFQGLMLPLLVALFLIFLYPIPAKYIYQYWKIQQKELKKIKQQIEDETPLTIQESRDLKKKHDSLESHYEMLIVNKDREIDSLNKLIEQRDRAISQNEETIKRFNKSNFEKESQGYIEKIEILSTLSKYGELNVNEIVDKTKLDDQKANYEIGELRETGYISIDSKHNPLKYRIEQRGRRKLVEEGKI